MVFLEPGLVLESEVVSWAGPGVEAWVVLLEPGLVLVVDEAPVRPQLDPMSLVLKPRLDPKSLEPQPSPPEALGVVADPKSLEPQLSLPEAPGVGTWSRGLVGVPGAWAGPGVRGCELGWS